MHTSKRSPDVLQYERQARKEGFTFVLGVDEAGRGPLAGPVVAAAVCLRKDRFERPIRDSKQMTSLARELAFLEIQKKAYTGVGIVSETAIDELNILQATFVAMNNAILQLVSRIPDLQLLGKDWQKGVKILVDGNRFRSDLPCVYQTIVDGDALSLSISCASIVAKVIRDRILRVYHQVWPQYGFDRHKGYPTVAHRKAIKDYGPSLIHRRTFQAKIS